MNDSPLSSEPAGPHDEDRANGEHGTPQDGPCQDEFGPLPISLSECRELVGNPDKSAEEILRIRDSFQQLAYWMVPEITERGNGREPETEEVQ
jgi:hypothetical protein